MTTDHHVGWHSPGFQSIHECCLVTTPTPTSSRALTLPVVPALLPGRKTGWFGRCARTRTSCGPLEWSQGLHFKPLCGDAKPSVLLGWELWCLRQAPLTPSPQGTLCGPRNPGPRETVTSLVSGKKSKEQTAGHSSPQPSQLRPELAVRAGPCLRSLQVGL